MYQCLSWTLSGFIRGFAHCIARLIMLAYNLDPGFFH